MEARKLIQRVQSAYSKGVPSDDSRLSSRHIYNKLNTVRNRLLSQKSKKRQIISQWSYQTLECIELIKVNKSHYTNPIGCPVLRSKNKIPSIIINYDRHLIEYVTDLENTKRYSETSWKRVKYKHAEKYTSGTPEYFLKDDYLYVTSINSARVVTMSAVFADQLAALRFPVSAGCISSNSTCINPLDEFFRIDGDLVEQLIEISLNELVVLFSKSVEDKTNNSQDSPIEISK